MEGKSQEQDLPQKCLIVVQGEASNDAVVFPASKVCMAICWY
jgi:hypothetical protein